MSERLKYTQPKTRRLLLPLTLWKPSNTTLLFTLWLRNHVNKSCTVILQQAFCFHEKDRTDKSSLPYFNMPHVQKHAKNSFFYCIDTYLQSYERIPWACAGHKRVNTFQKLHQTTTQRQQAYTFNTPDSLTQHYIHELNSYTDTVYRRTPKSSTYYISNSTLHTSLPLCVNRGNTVIQEHKSTMFKN